MSDLLYGNNLRIVEYTDSNGVSRFVPQRKMLWWWFCFETYPCGPLEFSNFAECKDWLLYRRTVSRKVHAV